MAQRSSVGLRAGARSVSLAAALLAWGCGHTEPFTSPPYGSDAPFDASPPQRLTYNDAADRGPSWLPDGSGLLYSSQQNTRPDDDVCLALLPPTGGTQQRLWCDVPGGGDNNDALESAAVSPGGRLGFLSATGDVGAPNPLQQGIAVASTLDPREAQIVRLFLFTPEGLQVSAQFLRWLDATHMVYVGQRVSVRAPCNGCLADTLRAGEAVTILDVDAVESPAIVVPGTEGATGAAVHEDGAIFYTLGGDNRVYRYVPSTAETQIVHDFGAAGIARDVQVVGTRIAAVVGGRVAFGSDQILGPTQFDSGGIIHVVDLSSGTDVVLDFTGRLYRRPALSPAGDRLSAEGYPLIITQITPTIADTTVSRSGDIYLFGAP